MLEFKTPPTNIVVGASLPRIQKTPTREKGASLPRIQKTPARVEGASLPRIQKTPTRDIGASLPRIQKITTRKEVANLPSIQKTSNPRGEASLAGYVLRDINCHSAAVSACEKSHEWQLAADLLIKTAQGLLHYW